MPNFEEVQAAIDSADDLTKLGAACKTVAESLDFSHFLLGFRVPLSLEKPYQLIYSSYPKLWRKHYDDNKYFTVDPVVRRALTTSVPFAWEDLTADSPEAAKLFQEAARFGLTHGIRCPRSRGQREWRASYFGSLKAITRKLGRKAPAIADCFMAHGALTRPTTDCAFARERIEVWQTDSQRRQCLKLAASGLSAGLISRQIDISERTVVYYLGRAEEKLGVRTRQHAIARAIFLGELEPDCYPMLISQSQKVIDIGN